jgi:hypothetical protein
VSVIREFASRPFNVYAFMEMDASFRVRLESFNAYLHTFAEAPFLGDAFSLHQGGGLVSIMAGLGVAAAVLFLAFLVRAAAAPMPVSTVLLLTVWFAVHFISGPVGIPILGLIIGLVLRGMPVPLRMAAPSRSLTRAPG